MTPNNKILSACLIILFTMPAWLPASEDVRSLDTRNERTAQFPLYFIENQGQLDREVFFHLDGTDRQLYFTSSGITISLSDTLSENDEQAPGRWILQLAFVDANGGVIPLGVDRQRAVISYFTGQKENWNTGVPTFKHVMYEELWPGIDLSYSGTVNQLKYEFHVKPGADPERIRMAYSGAESVSYTATGGLKVHTPVGGFEDQAPVGYQVIAGERYAVPMEYDLHRKADQAFSYGFEVGAYDPTETLIIDPALIIYCGFIGGEKHDNAQDIAVDEAGCAYVTGYKNNFETGFPLKVGPDLTYNGGISDCFVAKVNPAGTELIYCGYIGGDEVDMGHAIDVDERGNAYIAGATKSEETSFPVNQGPDLTHNGSIGAFGDAFIAKVNPQGTDLVYCGYIGGDRDESAQGVAVDASGCAYLTGWTGSERATFPVRVGPDLSFNGGLGDAFVAKVNPWGTGLEYCGYIGGAGDFSDNATGIAVDDKGRACICGGTVSMESSFPVLFGPDLTFNGNDIYPDGFIARVNAWGTALEYCGYIGGDHRDFVNDIAVDEAYCAHVTGMTESDEGSFPVKIGPDLTYNGESDAFEAKVASDGTELIHCGYVGGEADDYGTAIDVDPWGNAYITGVTESTQNSFPVRYGPDLSFNGFEDIYIARVNAAGSDLDFCGYIGGDTFDYSAAIEADARGHLFVAGYTQSTEATFPVTVGPGLVQQGDTDCYVARIAYRPLEASPLTIPAGAGGKVLFTLDAGAHHADRDYMLLASASGILPGYALPGGITTLPLNYDILTEITILMANSFWFEDFRDTLNAAGGAAAQLDAPSLPPTAVGVVLDFAFCLYNPFDFASNAVAIEVVP